MVVGCVPECSLLWDFLVSGRVPAMPGPISCIHGLLSHLGWIPSQDKEWVWQRPNDVDFHLLWPHALFQHEVRRSLRYTLV